MLIDQTTIIHCYEKIQKRATHGGVTVVIFVAFDADSLCSLKILTGLLKGDNIAYKVYPVSGYTQLETSIAECQQNENLQSMVFLNCGGVLDLTKKWFVIEKTNIKAYVFDNHRPIHHHNITDKTNIMVIEDGTQNQQNCPQRDDELRQNLNPGDMDDEDEDDFEYDADKQGDSSGEEEEDKDRSDFEVEEDEDESNNYPKSKQKERSEEESDEEQDEESEIEFKEQRRSKSSNLRKRKSTRRLKEKKMEKKIKLDQQRQKMENYYEGYYYGGATSMLMYKISQQSNKENNDYLWYTILGATDLLVHSKITDLQYDQMFQELAIEVEKVNIIQQENKFADINDSQNVQSVEQKKRTVGFIEASNEYRFICLRNWNLYESMYFSNYFATKLGIWNEKGEKNLKKFIALLGIPLEEARQQFRFMGTQFKDKLKEHIHEEATKFKMDKIMFSSFTRQIDEKTQLSATDVVYSLTAIMECPKQILQNIFEDPLKVKDTDSNSNGDKSSDNDIFDRIKNFWWAYETISSSESYLLLKGIDQAIQFQKSLVQEAKFVIDRDQITQCCDFRFVKLNNDTYSQNQYFQHPYSLKKLALFLMDIFKERQKSQKEIKPIVLCIKNSAQHTCTIIGVVGNYFASNTKNNFAHKFQDAAKSLSLQFKQDDFETSIIEIQEKDFEVFLDEIILTK